METARKAGKAAAQAGEPRTANPYRQYEHRKSWEIGFDAEQRTRTPLLAAGERR
jgi:ribosome modulation factor